VFNLENNRQIDLRLNDRGPFVTGRVIDLSYEAARKMGIVEAGTAKVRVVALGKATAYSPKTSKPVKFEPVDYWKGNFTIQVGAFTEKNNAINLKTKLERQFKNTHVVVHKDYRGTFYRVRIMKFVNLRDAMAFSEKYTRSGRGESFVVAE
jgi:rare lipoprotein A